MSAFSIKLGKAKLIQRLHLIQPHLLQIADPIISWPPGKLAASKIAKQMHHRRTEIAYVPVQRRPMHLVDSYRREFKTGKVTTLLQPLPQQDENVL